MPSGDFDHENLDALEGLQRGDVEPLVELLKDTERPMHKELRLWLALMLIGDTQTRWWLECKRHPGFQHPDKWVLSVRDLVMGQEIHRLWDNGTTITNAKTQVKKARQLNARTMDNAWIRYRQLYFRLKADGISFAEGLRPLREKQR